MEGKRTILVADDDRDLVRTLRDGLERNGFETCVAYEGVRTIELAHKKKPDLIILDMRMPVGEGATVLDNLRSHRETEKIPVLVLTGVDRAGLEEEVKKLGAREFIKKPCDLDFLIIKIRKYLS